MFSTRVSRQGILLCILLGCFLGTAIYMYQNAAKTRYSLVDRRADIHIEGQLTVGNGTLLDTLSQVADTELRSKFQKHQVEKFCKKYPNIPYNSKSLKKQIILNQDKKVLFCVVQKNGCTSIMKLFLAHSGLFSVNDLLLNDLNLGHMIKQIQLRNFELKPGELSEYYKMTMVRNPLERLVSAYRHKLSYPIMKKKSASADINYSINLQRDVFQTIHPEEHKKWLKDPSLQYTVTFADFIKFVIIKPNDQLDVHYQPVINLCQPCVVKYDFYNVLNRFNQDSQVLLNKLGASEAPDTYQVSTKTPTETLQQYYSKLSPELKRLLFRDWYSELEFYYHICPEERHSHKEILNIDEDIPIDL